MIFDIPVGSKDSGIIGRCFLDIFSDHFVLKVEGLNRSSDEIIATYSFLFIFFIGFVGVSDVCILFGVGGRGEVEGENGGGFFEEDVHIFL